MMLRRHYVKTIWGWTRRLRASIVALYDTLSLWWWCSMWTWCTVIKNIVVIYAQKTLQI